MTSIDTNLLIYAYAEACPQNQAAMAFVSSLILRENVAISEFVLAEFYLLLRNPAVLENCLEAKEAVEVINCYRHHPRWQVVGFPPSSRKLHDKLWETVATIPSFARRRLFDVRTALTLKAFGVTEFATANVKDFQDLGFERVWNPIDPLTPLPPNGGHDHPG